MATDHPHDEPFELKGPRHQLSYEPDWFPLKTILAVPVAVIVTGVLAFFTTSILFGTIFGVAEQNPSTFPIAAERGKASLNDRLTRMSSQDPKSEITQPRLEAMQIKKQTDHGDGFVLTSEMTTQQPAKSIANSPRYHPEDLRADRWPQLNTYSVTKDKNIAHIPVDKAIEIILKGNLLPARKDAKPLPLYPEWDRPKEANGGQPTTERK